MSVRVSPSVVRQIAILAALEVEGTSGPVSWFPFRHDPKHSVRLSVSEGRLQIELRLSFQYGVDLLKTARQVQDVVRRTVENLVGVEVRSVDVLIEEIEFRVSDAPAES